MVSKAVDPSFLGYVPDLVAVMVFVAYLCSVTLGAEVSADVRVIDLPVVVIENAYLLTLPPGDNCRPQPYEVTVSENCIALPSGDSCHPYLYEANVSDYDIALKLDSMRSVADHPDAYLATVSEYYVAEVRCVVESEAYSCPGFYVATESEYHVAVSVYLGIVIVIVSQSRGYYAALTVAAGIDPTVSVSLSSVSAHGTGLRSAAPVRFEEGGCHPEAHGAHACPVTTGRCDAEKT
jgi:hypothetical protein